MVINEFSLSSNSLVLINENKLNAAKKTKGVEYE